MMKIIPQVDDLSARSQGRCPLRMVCTGTGSGTNRKARSPGAAVVFGFCLRIPVPNLSQGFPY